MSYHVTAPGYAESQHCPRCGSFARRIDGGTRWRCCRSECGHEFSPAVPTASTADWVPRRSADSRKRCARCGAGVTDGFHRVWSDNDGVLDGCRECLPRSVRFGEDVYGRTKDEAERSYDLEAPNRGKSPEDLRNS